MIEYLLISLLALISFYSLGGIMTLFLGSKHSFTEKIILGLVLHYVLTGIAQMFFPVNILVTLVITTLTIGFHVYKGSLKYFEWKRLGLFLIFTLLLFPLVFGTKTYDHYLYYDQTVSWFNQYPIVPGLANLHGRFGFNNSIFVTVSSFQVDYTSNFYFLNLFLFVLLGFRLYESFVYGVSNRLKIPFVIISGMLWYSKPYLNGISPDFASFVFLQFLLVTILDHGIRKISKIPFIIILAIFLITIKLTFIIFSLLLIISIFIVNKREGGTSFWFKNGFLLFVVSSIWVVRSIILTGQLVYPLPALYTNYFTHSVVKEQVTNEKISVTGWAQSPGRGYHKRYLKNKGSLNWVPQWYKKRFNQGIARIPFIGKISIRWLFWLGLLSFFSVAVTKIHIDSKLVYLFLIFNMAFWFILGPDVRFGFPLFIGIFLYGICLTEFGITKYALSIFISYVLFYNLFDFSRRYVRCLSIYSSELPTYQWNTDDKKNDKFKVFKDSFQFSNDGNHFQFYNTINSDQSATNVFPSFTENLNNRRDVVNITQMNQRLKIWISKD